jgi:hypothetical protein
MRVRAYIGIIAWRARIEGCCVTAVFEKVAAFGVHVEAGVSSASMSDVSSAFIPATNGWITRVVTDNRASLVDFKPSPRASESRPKPSSSKTSSSSPVKVAMDNAWA